MKDGQTCGCIGVTLEEYAGNEKKYGFFFRFIYIWTILLYFPRVFQAVQGDGFHRKFEKCLQQK